jgi:SAM-dependent methyltransferase
MAREQGLIRDQIQVLAIAEGFFGAQVLFAMVELGVFEAIGDGEHTAEEVATATGDDPGAMARLLAGGAVAGLLRTDDGIRFRTASFCRSVLARPGDRGYLGNWITNMEYLQRSLTGLADAVRSGERVIDLEDDLEATGDRSRNFILAMHDFAALRGVELGRCLDTAGCASMLDVGCGPGTYSFVLGETNPGLELHLMDLPEVLTVAREVQGRYTLAGEVHYLPGDARTDEIPGTYDLVLLSNFLHMLGPADSRALLQRLVEHVEPNGSVVIQGQFLDERRTGPRWPVFMDLTLLSMTETGRNHTTGDAEAWLKEAGFTDIVVEPMSMMNANTYVRGFKR